MDSPWAAVYAKHALSDPHTIRVVDLERPDSPGARIRMSTRVIQLTGVKIIDYHGAAKMTWSSTSPYQALSYAWGTNKAADWIYLDGMEFSVTDNLYRALKQIRDRVAWGDEGKSQSRFFSRTLWVDAICINQQDDAEKSQQVTFMAAIYSGAKGLVIWLGECSDDDSMGLRRAVMQRDSSAEDKNVALRLLGQASWFRRRWIVQELMLSSKGVRHVLCGQASFRFEQLVLRLRSCAIFQSHFTVNGMSHLPPPLIRMFYAANPLLVDFQIREKPWERRILLENLTHYADLECGLRADRVFSLLGISEDADRFMFQYPVDYSHKQDSSQVFINLAKYYHLSGKPELRATDTAMFAYASATAWSEAKRLSDMPQSGKPPSWVANWAAKFEYSSAQHAYLVKDFRDAIESGSDPDIKGRAFIHSLSVGRRVFPAQSTEEDVVWAKLRELQITFEQDFLLLEAYLLWPCRRLHPQKSAATEDLLEIDASRLRCSYCHLADNNHRWPISSDHGQELVNGLPFLPDIQEGQAIVAHTRWRFALIVTEVQGTPSRSFRLASAFFIYDPLTRDLSAVWKYALQWKVLLRENHVWETIRMI